MSKGFFSFLGIKRCGIVFIGTILVLAAAILAIVIPSYQRAKERSAVTTILNELRLIDAAIEKYAVENDKSGNLQIEWKDLVPYLPPHSRLIKSEGKDPLNYPYVIGTIDKGVKLNLETQKLIAPHTGTNYINPEKNTDKSPKALSQEALDQARPMVEANNQFVLEFFTVLKEKEGNLFFSPYNILSSLAILLEGATGLSANQIQTTTHLPKDLALQRASFAAVEKILNPTGADYKLFTGYSLWLQKSYPFTDFFLSDIKKYYGPDIAPVDFIQQPEETSRKINQWCDEKTMRRIPGKFSKDSFSDYTRLIFVSSIYFKGLWEEPFEKASTTKEDFKVNLRQAVKTDMMHQEIYSDYFETKEFQALKMLYKGKDLSLLVLLPKTQDLSSMEKSLSSEKLKHLRKDLKSTLVDVYFPKITFSQEIRLDEEMKRAGITLIFDPQKADFYKMTGQRFDPGENPFVQSILQNVFLEINEEGTEAVALTGTYWGPLGDLPPPPVPVKFRADHPFLFFIQEEKTGLILFMGRVMNPAEKG